MPKSSRVVYDATFTAGATVTIPVTFADADSFTVGFNRVSAGATFGATMNWLVNGATALSETLLTASTALATVSTAVKTAYTADANIVVTSTAAQTMSVWVYKKYQGA